MDNKTIMEKLDLAIKGITEISTLGSSILQPAKFNRFVQMMEQSTTILNKARFIRMDSPIVDIDLISMSGRVLRAGRSAAAGGGTVVELVAGTHDVTPTTYTNQLIAKELVGLVSLRDDTIRRSIEGANFENTLLDLFSSAAGRNIEELGVFGDVGVAYGTDNLISQTNGWLKKAGNKLYGSGVSKDFDPAAVNYPENMFDAMLSALPKQYYRNPSDWEFSVTWDTFNAYQNLLKARGTALGDVNQTGAPMLWYKGIKVLYTPVLESASPSAAADDGLMTGETCMLQNYSNATYGVLHEMTLERDRDALGRKTNFVLAMECDFHYEDTNAVVVALIDKEAP